MAGVKFPFRCSGATMEKSSESVRLDPLPNLPLGSPLGTEWNTFRRELPRLLQEGHQNRYALIQGETVAAVWGTLHDATQAGYQRFGLTPFLVQKVVLSERPLRAGWLRRCCT
jgi:hypothetical protein